MRTGLRTRGRRGRSRAARVAAAALLAWPLAAWAAAESLLVESKIERADALVVLSGSSTLGERTGHAARLFHAGRAPVIILTNDGQRGGWSAAEQRNPFFYEKAAAELRALGVPAASVRVIERPASSTHEEALLVREYAGSQGARSLLVVTTPYQSRRALWVLRRVFEGSNVSVGLDAPPPGVGTPPTATWWWHASGWRLVPGEYAKLAYYAVRYR